MELKQLQWPLPATTALSLNRTIMELKHIEAAIAGAYQGALNRTIMELKRVGYNVAIFQLPLLIAP